MSIIIKDISVTYGNKAVLDNCNVQFGQGVVSVILGRSGCGKTTLLNSIAGLVPYKGVIDGIDKVAYVFQQPYLIDNISVYDNLMLTTKHVIADKSERHNAIMQMLQDVDMSDKHNRKCATLSGGEQQRVSIARAFLSNATVLLLDEPMQGLDIVAKQKFNDILIRLIDKYECTVLYVTHDLYDCLTIADDIYVMGGTPIAIDHVATISHSRHSRNVTSQYAQVKQLLIDKLSQ